MWCLLYVPTLLTVASTLACYLWCGFKTDKSAFMSARPEDPTLRCLQVITYCGYLACAVFCRVWANWPMLCDSNWFLKV